MNIFTHFDKTVFQWINKDWSNPALDFIMPLLTHLGDQAAVWICIFFISVLTCWQLIHLARTNQLQGYRYKVMKTVVFFSFYMALIYGLNAAAYSSIKHFFHRPRPFLQHSAIIRVSQAEASGLSHTGSFPSGHACNAFMIAVFLASRFKRKQYLFFVIATMVALSRVYVGVHYPSDVLIGSLQGLIMTLFMLSFAKQPENAVGIW